MSDGFTVQIDPRSLQQLAALNRELGQYAVLARKTMDETLDKKGLTVRKAQMAETRHAAAVA